VSLNIFALLLCLSGYFNRYADPAELVQSRVDLNVMQMILNGVTPQQEEAFKREFDAWFVKGWCPPRSARAPTPLLRSELKGIFMVFAVACMNVSDPFGDDQVELQDSMESWRNNPKYESAYQAFATILFGVGESMVRGRAFFRPENVSFSANNIGRFFLNFPGCPKSTSGASQHKEPIFVRQQHLEARQAKTAADSGSCMPCYSVHLHNGRVPDGWSRFLQPFIGSGSKGVDVQ
jgi:hypothetical protein